jgi:(R,R)-butanediol dehydrogenase/meso-butanediol dehydrogenase/diacetyl reductase
MKAAQFFDKGHIEVVDVDEPTPADDELLVEIHWCGIYGSDLHEYIMGGRV